MIDMTIWLFIWTNNNNWKEIKIIIFIDKRLKNDIIYKAPTPFARDDITNTWHHWHMAMEPETNPQNSNITKEIVRI